MQVGATGIEIVLLTAEEEHGAGEVDHNAYTCYDGHGAALHGRGMTEPDNGLVPQNCYSYKENNGIDECGKHSGFFIAIGKRRAGLCPGEAESEQGNKEAGDIGEVVAGIGEEGNRIGIEAGGSLNDDKCGIEHYAPYKRSVDLGAMVMMVVAMMVAAMAVMVVTTMVMVATFAVMMVAVHVKPSRPP